jgi:regulator of protease activity HflC (stomatin/prohibitin superfamily)
LRLQALNARLGLEVVDFALLNLHPPIEASGSYLDIINARLDARRRVIEAEGNQDVALLKAQSQSAVAVSSSQIEASRRIATALGETSEFKALAAATQTRSPTLRFRMWVEAMESALAEQRIFLVDQTLLNQKGELILDTRTGPSQTLRPLDSTPLPPVSGPN